jgi:hypothetical protein
MPAYVAYLHCGVGVYLFGSGRRDIELGRHEEVPDFGDTADEVVDLLARHLGEVTKDQDYPDYAAAGRFLLACSGRCIVDGRVWVNRGRAIVEWDRWAEYRLGPPPLGAF